MIRKRADAGLKNLESPHHRKKLFSSPNPLKFPKTAKEKLIKFGENKQKFEKIWIKAWSSDGSPR